MADEFNPIFKSHVRDYCEKNDIDLESLQETAGLKVVAEKSEEDLIDEEEETAPKREQNEMHDIFKKLFKKLAVHLHPDKVMGLTDEERHDRLEMFKDAKRALDDEHYFFLLDLSDKFNITLPNNYKQQTRWMKARSIELDSEISSMKASFNYTYADCDTDEEREKLVVMFLSQVYGI